MYTKDDGSAAEIRLLVSLFPAMNEDYARQVLRAVLGRVCQPLGVHGMQSSVCETMADVLKRYLLALGRTTAAYCAHGEIKFSNIY